MEYNTRQQIEDNDSGGQDRYCDTKEKRKKNERNHPDPVLVQVP